MDEVQNPPNPYASEHVEWLGEPPPARLVVYEERSRSILAENNSPDIPFRYSLNPYRGCQHACAYCYARTGHEQLGFGAGTDFDTKIIVKTNAPELLRQRFRKPSWTGERIAFSGDTDCYQPLEVNYGLTRACLELCLEFRNPVGLITKSALVRRDVELWRQLAQRAAARVTMSVAFAELETARALEPWTPAPAARFAALRALTEAGVPSGILIGPVVPGLNDDEIPTILERARAAGARWAGMIPLRLPGSVAQVFFERLRAARPGRAERVQARVREMRGGALHEGRFFHRYGGQGPYWEAIEQLFQAHHQRLGFEPQPPEVPTPFRRSNEMQLDLFGDAPAEDESAPPR